MENQIDIFDVQSHLCVVTGASSGMGLYCAEQLALRGARVFGVSRSVPAERAPIAGLTHLVGDVTDFDGMATLINTIERDTGPITAFINNAGVAAHGKPGTTDAVEMRAILETNTVAPAVLTDLVAGRMAKNGVRGSIINVSSALAQKGMARLASYGASKAGLEAMTRQQAAHWGRSGIRINAFAPGWFSSDMTSESLAQGLEPILKGMTPLRRVGTVEDMLGPVIFLISNASQFVTGAVICADGGYSV